MKWGDVVSIGVFSFFFFFYPRPPPPPPSWQLFLRLDCFLQGRERKIARGVNVGRRRVERADAISGRNSIAYPTLQ